MIKKGLVKHRNPRVTSAAAAVAVALSLGQTAQGIELDWGSWQGSLDTTITVGSSWRVEERDDRLVGHSNLLNLGPGQLSALPGSGVELTQGAWSNNGDDGNRNFDKGDAFSQVIKITPELSLNHESGFGLFARATGFYDRALMEGDFTGTGQTDLTRRALHEQGRKSLKMLDFFVYKTFDFEETTAQVRLGQQVISWGESTFIQHGLSEINAVDVTKLRVPGAEIKEALIPVRTLWGSVDLSDNVNIEAYVQFEWQPFRTDEPGTYFATQDFTGYSGRYIHLGFSQFGEFTPGTVAYRMADRDAKDTGQYGLKLAWFAEELNGTEFGFYFVNYHNKRPLFSAYTHDLESVKGFFEYPEDIQMYGFSFNTSTDSGLSIAGEMTYRKDEPLQIDDVEILFATLEPIGSIPPRTSQLTQDWDFSNRSALFGQEISGYRLLDNVQIQATITGFMGPTWGAEQWVLLAEFGANFILDMPSQDELRFNAPGTSRSGNPERDGRGLGFIDPTSPCSVGGVPVECEGVETNPFADDVSWGYRFVSKWDYTNAIWGWNVRPRIVLQHDVSGTTPGPISNFVEGRKALTLGVGFDYQSTWKADIGYSAFSGAGTANLLSDRDFVAVSLSYSF